jgi:hypothetical protein
MGVMARSDFIIQIYHLIVQVEFLEPFEIFKAIVTGFMGYE